MNAEIRDHSVFLKGALDLLTNSTTADTGAATYLQVKRTAVVDAAYEAGITGDTVMRWSVDAQGRMRWGGGTSAADVELYRGGVDILETNDSVRIVGPSATAQRVFGIMVSGEVSNRMQMQMDTSGTARLEWGPGTSSPDVTLYRDAANRLVCDDHVIASDGVATKIVAGVVSDASFTAATVQNGTLAVDTTNSRLYVKVGATWKSVLLA